MESIGLGLIERTGGTSTKPIVFLIVRIRSLDGAWKRIIEGHASS